MKKVLLFLSICGLVVFSTSCKKEKDCECTTTTTTQIEGMESEDLVATLPIITIDGKDIKNCSDLEKNYTLEVEGISKVTAKCVEK